MDLQLNLWILETCIHTSQEQSVKRNGKGSVSFGLQGKIGISEESTGRQQMVWRRKLVWRMCRMVTKFSCALSPETVLYAVKGVMKAVLPVGSLGSHYCRYDHCKACDTVDSSIDLLDN